MMTEVQQRATQAISGIATALTDITQELHNVQQQLQYWRVEADAWKARYEQERARNSRLRRVLRCAPQYPSNSLSMARSLTSTPNALRGTSSALYPNVSTAVDAELSAQQHQLQEEAAGASACRRRSSSDAKSPLSPQRQPQQQEQQSISNASTSSSPTCPIQQQQPQSFTQQRQTLRPLKCVPEGDSTSSSSSGLQPGSTSTPPAHISTSTATETTSADQGSAAAATAAPAGSESPSADPFAHYDGGPVSDPGEPFRLQPRSSDSGPPPAYPQQLRDTSTAGTTLSPAAAAAAVPAFRRTQTMPVGGSLSAVQSPSFAAGWGPGSFLHQAASWLPPMGGQSSGDKTNGRHTVDQLLRVMMAFTLMQGTTDDQQSGYSPDEDVLPSVSLDDDDGSSGVGLAAAAAVSAAMARAWATAASREQKAVAAASGGGGGQQGASKMAGREPGSSSSGRAGFRLVATVTNKMGKRQASASALSSYASQDSMSGLDSSAADLGSLIREPPPVSAPSPRPPGLPVSKQSSSSSLARTGSADPPGAAADGSSAHAGSGSPSRPSRFAAASTAAAAAAAAVGDAAGSSSPSRQPQLSSSAASSAAKPAAAPAAGAAPSSSQATTISLQWLSRPRTVLVVRKLAPSTEAAFLRTLDWLRRHQVTIFIEPKVFQELVDAGRVIPLAPSQQQQQQQQQQPKGPVSNSSSSDDAAASGSSGGKVVTHSGSSSSLAGMLISTSPGQASPQSAGLFPVCSWAGPSTSGSNGGSSGCRGLAAVPPAAGAGAVVGAGGAAAGVIKTWQPELRVDQSQEGQDPEQQQQQQGDNASGGSSLLQESDLIPDAVAQQLDLVVVLGGDGTVLWTCHIFGNRSVPPLVPFNLGSLGFLTPFDPARLEQVLLKTFRGSFAITLRHRLHCTIVRCSTSCPAPDNSCSGGLPSVSNSCVGHCVYGEEHVSLNEVVIERGISPFLTNLECFCDGTFVTHVQGDGLIVGTPTGSTAYSLAAGGSMVHPQVPCILFTPICPHSLSFRPLMFPDYVQLCVQVPADARGHVWASFDGKDRTELGPGDAVVIRLSKWPVPSVAAEADPSSDWFSAVRECLHWNMRKVQGGAGM